MAGFSDGIVKSVGGFVAWVLRESCVGATCSATDATCSATDATCWAASHVASALRAYVASALRAYVASALRAHVASAPRDSGGSTSYLDACPVEPYPTRRMHCMAIRLLMARDIVDLDRPVSACSSAMLMDASRDSPRHVSAIQNNTAHSVGSTSL